MIVVVIQLSSRQLNDEICIYSALTIIILSMIPKQNNHDRITNNNLIHEVHKPPHKYSTFHLSIKYEKYTSTTICFDQIIVLALKILLYPMVVVVIQLSSHRINDGILSIDNNNNIYDGTETK